MEVISPSSTSSRLNPNAPMFVPLAYLTVEDFSDEWWNLVRSSAWFRDYWLRECFQDPQYQNELFDFDFDLDLEEEEEENEGEEGKEVVSLGVLKWRSSGGGWAEAPRYVEKAPKFVKPKVSPRAIHQPR